MSPGTLQGAAGPAAFMAGILLVFIMHAGAWARVCSPASHCF